MRSSVQVIKIKRVIIGNEATSTSLKNARASSSESRALPCYISQILIVISMCMHVYIKYPTDFYHVVGISSFFQLISIKVIIHGQIIIWKYGILRWISAQFWRVVTENMKPMCCFIHVPYMTILSLRLIVVYTCD